MEDDEFLIHVEIAAKKYPLTIKRSEEKLTRAAAVQLNRMIENYQIYFGTENLNLKDLLAMVALHLSINNLQLEQAIDIKPFEKKIVHLTEMLEDYIKESK